MNNVFVKTHQPCPCGKSSDSYSMREDGSGKCFSCGEHFNSTNDHKELTDDNSEVSTEYDFRSLRGISRKTFEKYGVLAKIANGTPVSLGFPYFDYDGNESVKIRSLSEKKFSIISDKFSACMLFGQQIFDKGSYESITIFEGELDSMSGFEMLRSKSACVSLKSGAGSAVKDIKDHYDYLNSYKKIYLCFDNDRAGKDAIKSIQGLFDFRKVYHVQLSKYKDANEYLVNGDANEFESVWKSSKRFVPDNILSSFTDIRKALDEQDENLLGTYPFNGLNSFLYGLHEGEVIVIKAFEGVGKTEFFRSLEYNILKTTKLPIGIIHLEEANGTTIKALAGMELGVRAVLPDCGLSKNEIFEGYKNLVENEDRVNIHSSFDVEDEESFIGNIRFLVSVLGCKFIFLDHISWLATGIGDDDERRKLDRISQKLKLLAKELSFCLIMISHVNDDGKTRGSRNITKVANTVIHLDRDVESGDKNIAVTVQKARLSGRTGLCCILNFDDNEGKLQEVS